MNGFGTLPVVIFQKRNNFLAFSCGGAGCKDPVFSTLEVWVSSACHRYNW